MLNNINCDHSPRDLSQATGGVYRQQCDRNAMKQWSSRRSDQSTEDLATRNVRSSRPKISYGSHATASPHKLRMSQFKGYATTPMATALDLVVCPLLPTTPGPGNYYLEHAPDRPLRPETQRLALALQAAALRSDPGSFRGFCREHPPFGPAPRRSGRRPFSRDSFSHRGLNRGGPVQKPSRRSFQSSMKVRR